MTFMEQQRFEREQRKKYERMVLNDLLVSAHVKMDLLKIQLDELEKILKQIDYIKYNFEGEK